MSTQDRIAALTPEDRRMFEALRQGFRDYAAERREREARLAADLERLRQLEMGEKP
jgi:hypothetical protein